MKRDLVKLCILSLILIIISTFIILLFGNTYNAVFITRGNVNKVIADNKTGDVEILDEKKIGDKYIVKDIQLILL